MFKELFKRQIVEDIISLRFLINFVLVLGTLIIFPLIFVNHYHALRETHAANIDGNNLRLREAAQSLVNLLTVEQELSMRPKFSSFISHAYEDKIPQGLSFCLNEIKLLSKERESDGLSFYSPDLTFVVQFLLSFFAIVLTFNAISSEKERGTLRLVFSNPVKRAYLVSTKYLSALVTVALPLLFGLVVALILLNLLKVVSFSFGLFLDFVLFFLISLFYISFFILLGISCSAASHSSRNSLVLCLLFWILLVVILPKSAGLLLGLKGFDVPTEKQIEEFAEKSEGEIWNRHAGEDWVTRTGQDESTKLNVKISNDAKKARQEVFDFYLRKKIAAVSTLRRINFISPSSLLEYSASSLAGTGLFHFQNLWTQVRQYQNEYVDFFKREDMKDDESDHLYFHPDYLSRKPVDFEKIPQFEEREIKRAMRLKETLQYVGVLALYNLFLFSFAFFKFVKYDVR